MSRYRSYLLIAAILSVGTIFVFSGGAAAQSSDGETIELSESGFEQAHSLSYSSDGRFLAVGGTSGIYLVDAQKLSKEEFIGTHVWARTVAFQPGSHLLAAGLFDDSVKFWRVPGAQPAGSMDDPEGWVRSISFSADGALIASASDDETVRVWQVEDAAPLLVLENAMGVRAVALSPDGTRIAGAMADNTVRVWSVPAGTLIYTLTGHEDWPRCLDFSPDGQYLASGSFDTTIRLWSMADGKLEKTLTGHSSSVLGVVFSPDGKLLASGSVDETVRLWDVVSGAQIRVLQGHKDFVYSVAFSPDGHTLASGSADNTVRMWDVNTLGETDPTLEHPVVITASDCRSCHHRRGQVEPARVIELNCENCHPSGVSLTWCTGFPRSSLVEKNAVTYTAVPDVSGVPVNDDKLAVVIAAPGNGETLYVRGDFQAPEFVSGTIYYADSVRLSDVEIHLDIISNGETTASLVTHPTETGTFSFNVAINFTSPPPHLSRPGTRQCLICHGDFVPQAGLPKGDVHLVVSAATPDGQRAVDDRWVHVDPSGTVQVPVQVLNADSNEPLEGLSVEASAILYEWRNRFATATSGPAGKTQVGLDALSQAQTTYKITIPPQVLDGVLYESPAPIQLELDPASPVQPLTLTARPVTGQINGGLGNADRLMGDEKIWAVRLPAGPVYQASLAPQNMFTFDQIPISNYLVIPDLQAFSRQGLYAPSYTVDLLESPVTNISFSLEHGRVLSGSVRTQDGSSLPFAWVEIGNTGSIKAIDPATGSFVLGGIPSDVNFITLSAPGYYSLPLAVKGSVDVLEARLVPRPELRVFNLDDGQVFLPEETRAVVTDAKIEMESGWIWGENGGSGPLEVRLPGAIVRLSSGRFALEQPARGMGWLYVQDGRAEVVFDDGPDIVPVVAGQMVALRNGAEPITMDSLIAMALHPPLHELPVFARIEPSPGARIQTWLVRTGIGAMQTITFITYILSLVTLIIVPAIVLFSYWKKRRSSSNSQENH